MILSTSLTVSWWHCLGTFRRSVSLRVVYCFLLLLQMPWLMFAVLLSCYDGLLSLWDHKANKPLLLPLATGKKNN